MSGRRLHFLVTAGPTVEPIDAVRVLTNRSTGRMGYAIAGEAVRRGHDVTLVSGPVVISVPKGVRRIPVGTAREMLAACRRSFRAADVLVMAAAVSDYRPANPARRKRHKAGTHASLALVRNPDILAALCRGKGRRLAVGFALENAVSRARARRKMSRKGCDAIVVNALPSMGGKAFRGVLLPACGQDLVLGPTKEKAARMIVTWIARTLRKHR